MYTISIIFWVALFGGIIYLAIRRRQIKKTEDFENRDN